MRVVSDEKSDSKFNLSLLHANTMVDGGIDPFPHPKIK